MSNILVNGAIASLASVFSMLIGNLALTQSAFVLPLGILVGVLVFFLAGSINPDAVKAPSGRRGGVTAAAGELEEAAAKSAAKKAKRAAAEKAKREAAEAEKAEEAAAKAAAKKAAAQKAAKAGKKAAPVVESDSESESEAESEEEAVASAPKSKSAIKKAKAKAKEAAAKAEAEKAAKAAAAAEKKQKKKGGAAAEAAPVAAAAAAPAKKTAAEKASAKAAAAAAAADTEGWETIEAPKPTKSQAAKAAAAASSPAPSAKANKKQESVPTSERLLTEEIMVPVKNHALIIGSKGITLTTLVAGSGAEITMPKKETGSAKIQITGTPAQVASAKNAIESLVLRGFSKLTHPKTLSDDIVVDPKDMGLIMGPGGATLKQIQAKTGAKIDLPEKGSSNKKVVIVGEKDQVRDAKAALKSLIADGYSSITHPDWIKEEVEFPSDRFGILIGDKGQTIKSIQGDTKARIRLPERGSKSSTVTVVGTLAAVEKARKQIEKLLEPLAALPDPEEEDLATDDAWGQEHTAKGEDALW